MDSATRAKMNKEIARCQKRYADQIGRHKEAIERLKKEYAKELDHIYKEY